MANSANSKTDAKTTEIQETATKDLRNKSGEITKLVEWATQDVNSIDEMMALFEDQGVEYSHGDEITGDYQLITGDLKQAFLTRVAGKRMFIVKWEFNERDSKPFASFYCIIDGVGKYIINDGSKGGMFGQLSDITEKREASKPESANDGSSRAGLMVGMGVKKGNDFYYDTRTSKAIRKADLQEGSENYVPEEFRRKANPVWRFEFSQS